MKFISSIKLIMSAVVCAIISNTVNTRNMREQGPGSISPYMSNPNGLDINNIDNMRSIATKPDNSYRFKSSSKKQDSMEDNNIANKYKGVNKFNFYLFFYNKQAGTKYPPGTIPEGLAEYLV